MADEADKAADLMEGQMASRLKQNRKAVESIPAGNPGECDLCGEWFGRLVRGTCARCRDRYKLG